MPAISLRYGALLLLPLITGAVKAESPSYAPGSVKFELDVLPILTASGCNSGACHGKSRGQNGFQLSLLGFDADFDYAAIVKEARGRRVFPAAPEQSLLLQKPLAALPHGGGVRLKLGTSEYDVIHQWIRAGMPRTTPDDPVLQRISVLPAERVMTAHEQQPLQVFAHYSNHSTRDVTRLAVFQSNEAAIVEVDRGGNVTAGSLPGEATIMIRYMDQFATWSTAIPQASAVPSDLYANLPRNNMVDEFVWRKLEKLRITPSGPASDSTFLRRASLDIIGRLPTAAEARTFLAGTDPNKRARLIDALLQRPEYADFWANKWADLLRPNPYRVGIKATLNFDSWIRDAFRENRPYDQFVRELVTAQGSTWHYGAAVLYRDRRSPDEAVTMISQLFLGIRLECAKCHQHPFEKWGQDDFYSLAAFFARVGRKGPGVSPPISGGEEIIFTAAKGLVNHPLTGEELQPRPLFGSAPDIEPEEDPREALADWMLADDNPYFAQVAVNRVWTDLMGRGIVEPVDDLRGTNPPINPELLDGLSAEFRQQKYDLKQLIRLIATSYTYGLSSLPVAGNVQDTRNYSRHYRTQLRGEVLLDAICDVTGVREKFTAMPPGSRASELWTHRVDSLFLDAFGRPNENQDPPCERLGDTTVVQSLHLMNSENLQRKLASEEGRASQLAASGWPVHEVVDELYLLAYSRFPNDQERDAAVAVFQGATAKRQTIEDLLWALLNTPEFIFKD